MKKLIVILLISGMIISCKTNPHLNFKLKSEKVSNGCSGIPGAFRMNSNINGERYEWDACLPSGEGHAGVTLVRQGDTILVKMPAPGSSPAHYSLTLDVDAYPAYHFITVGNDTYIVATTNN